MRKSLLAPGEPPALAIRFDGAALPACPKDTVAAALIAAGELATSRSAKYRRPRGPACLRGDCGTCLVRVDGLPNQRACLTPVRPDMVVESQNTFGELDPTALFDQVFRRGIDHHHMVVYPKLANQVMQGVARELTGFGALPDAPPPPPGACEEHVPEVLVVGAGLSGRAVAAALARAGRAVLVVERRDRVALEAEVAAEDPGAAPLPAALLAATGVFACYPHEGLWAAASALPGEPPRLHRIRPRHVVLAVGAHEPTLLLANNDLPGVVSARGLRDMLRRTGRTLATTCVVIGAGEQAAALAEGLALDRLDPRSVRRLVGRRRVKAVELQDGTRRRCDLVALAPDPAPAFELAAQAGAPLRYTGAGFAPVCDGAGRVSARAAEHPLGPDDAPPAPSPWTLWAVGELAGAAPGAPALASASRCAEALLACLSEPGPEDSRHA